LEEYSRPKMKRGKRSLAFKPRRKIRKREGAKNPRALGDLLVRRNKKESRVVLPDDRGQTKNQTVSAAERFYKDRGRKN